MNILNKEEYWEERKRGKKRKKDQTNRKLSILEHSK